VQAGADGQGDAPEEVLPPEAQDADDGEVGREAVHGGPHDDLAAVLPPGGRRQPRARERGPDGARGAVELPVRLGELGRRHGGVLGAVDGGRRRRGGRGVRRAGGGGGGAPGLRGEVGVAADVEAVGLAEAVEAEERERGAEDEQVEEEDHQPEHVPALPPRPLRRGTRRRRSRRDGPRRRGGARVPAPVAGGGGGRGHGCDRWRLGSWGRPV